MTFASEHAAYLFYNNYAKENGFSIRREKVKKAKGLFETGEIRYRRFRCSKAWQREAKYLNLPDCTRRHQ